MTRYRPLPGLAALATVALVVVGVGCTTGGDSSRSDGGAGQVDAAGGDVDDAAGESSRGAGSEAVPVASGLPALDAKVVRTASLRLSVPRDAFESAVERVRAVAAGVGGYVVASDARESGRGRLAEGSIDVRVPVRSYERALASLAEVGRLVSRSESSTEVSGEYVDLESRARHLEAVERQLLELLERADTVPAALAVQTRLNATQLDLEQVRGRLRFLDDQTSFATISLALRERGDAPASASVGGWGVVDAWRDGARAFVHVAGRTFVVVAAAAPLLLLGALGFLGFRLVRRRAPGAEPAA